MADISKINIGGSTYDIKDATARRMVEEMSSDKITDGKNTINADGSFSWTRTEETEPVPGGWVSESDPQKILQKRADGYSGLDAWSTDTSRPAEDVDTIVFMPSPMDMWVYRTSAGAQYTVHAGSDATQLSFNGEAFRLRQEVPGGTEEIPYSGRIASKEDLDKKADASQVYTVTESDKRFIQNGADKTIVVTKESVSSPEEMNVQVKTDNFKDKGAAEARLSPVDLRISSEGGRKTVSLSTAGISFGSTVLTPGKSGTVATTADIVPGDQINDGTSTIKADRTFTAVGDDFTEWEYDYEGKGDWRELDLQMELEWITCEEENSPMYGQTAWFYGGSSWNVASTDKDATRLEYEAFDSIGSFAVVATRRRQGESGKLALQSDIAEWARAGKEAPGGSVEESSSNPGNAAKADAANSVPWSGVSDKPGTFNPSKHASSHGKNGEDKLTPDDIGALPKTGGGVGTSGSAGVLTLMATYDTAPRLEMESAFNAACSFNVPNSGKYDATGEGPKASLKKGGKEVAVEEDVKAVSDKVDGVSDKVDSISEAVSTDNRILISDDGVDARIQHADEKAEGGWADDAVLTTDKRLKRGYAPNDDAKNPKTQSVQVVTTSGVEETVTLKQPDKIDGGTRDFIVYVNHTNPEASTDTLLTLDGADTYYYEGDEGLDGFQEFFTIPKGVMSAWCFTEVPGGSVWAVGKSVLVKYTKGA